MLQLLYNLQLCFLFLGENINTMCPSVTTTSNNVNLLLDTYGTHTISGPLSCNCSLSIQNLDAAYTFSMSSLDSLGVNGGTCNSKIDIHVNSGRNYQKQELACNGLTSINLSPFDNNITLAFSKEGTNADSRYCLIIRGIYVYMLLCSY